MSWDYYGYYPKSTPIQNEGGIKARRGGKLGGEHWWAKRWTAVLESFNIGARLGRGRSYARKGQVCSIEIEAGAVTAEVQGSRPRPYVVTIKLQVLSAEEWDRVISELGARAVFLARLLAGEMPEQIEEATDAAGIKLFPAKPSDLKTDCSCPDWSNPCKHIAAVYYLLGEEFDRDPFLIFALRGMPREELLERLRGLSGAQAPAPAARQLEPEPLPTDPAAFYNSASGADAVVRNAHPHGRSAPLLRRLPEFPFWRGEDEIAEALLPAHAEAAQRAAETYMLIAQHIQTGADNAQGDEG